MTHEHPGRGVGPPAIPDHLAKALLHAQANHQASLENLRDAVSDYAEEMRANGASQADVLIAVRAIVAQTQQDATIDDNLIALLVAWCGEHWHRPTNDS